MKCPFERFDNNDFPKYFCKLKRETGFFSKSPCDISNKGKLYFANAPCKLITTIFSFHPEGKTKKEIKELLQKLYMIFLLEK